MLALGVQLVDLALEDIVLVDLGVQHQSDLIDLLKRTKQRKQASFNLWLSKVLINLRVAKRDLATKILIILSHFWILCLPCPADLCSLS